MTRPKSLQALHNLRNHHLLWPVVTLLLILAVDASLNPGFWVVQWRDGHLYGSVIDILNRSAPLMLTALGMTSTAAILTCCASTSPTHASVHSSGLLHLKAAVRALGGAASAPQRVLNWSPGRGAGAMKLVGVRGSRMG